MATSTLAMLVLVFIALPPAVDSPAMLAACMLIWGGLQGLAQTAMATLVTQAGASARGFAAACMSCTTYLAVAIGAATGGMLLQAHGFAVLCWAGAICVLLGSGVLLLRRRAMFQPE